MCYTSFYSLCVNRSLTSTLHSLPDVPKKNALMDLFASWLSGCCAASPT